MYDYKIFTMTVSCIFKDCTFNLINIGKYLDIDDNILGIKHHYSKTSILKGVYTTSNYKKSKKKNINKVNKVLFSNQVSLIIKTDNNIVNGKLFVNGSLHLTGIKNSQEAGLIIKLLYKKLLNLKEQSVNILITNNKDNVLLDNNNIIYSNVCPKYCLGYNLDNKYVIDKKTYVIDEFTGFFITDKIESKRIKSILNFDGVYIGYTKIELMKNKLKLYKTYSNIHFDYTIYNDGGLPYYLIYYDGEKTSSIIGKVVYYLNDNFNKVENIVKVLEYSYKCNPFKDNSISTELQFTTDINCINIHFNIGTSINRYRLFSKLINDKYICDLKSEKYPGLKFIYKKSLNNVSTFGICECTFKCTCTNITFSIFESGNVNVFGFKSEQDIYFIVSQFKKLIDKHLLFIKKRVF
jgi:TATA-box binding protein (TBP) (component of TFIID and TFIIIB)